MKPGFWAQRTLALLDQLKTRLPAGEWEQTRHLVALVTSQADALHRIHSTLNKAQVAQAELVMTQTMNGFEGEKQ